MQTKNVAPGKKFSRMLGTAAMAMLLLVVLISEFASSALGTDRYKTLYTFKKDNGQVSSGVILDAAGNLYGTTVLGGFNDGGTVYELTDKDGHWAKKVLYRFNRYGKGGFWPTGGLVLDPAGNLYGTTRGGGVNGGETLFELTPTADGTWKHTVIHTFPSGRKDGYGIGGPPILDSVGNLYCSTGDGGAYGYGTVVRLTPKGGGRWKESILHSFTSHGKAGSNPTENVTFDSAGNLYGATEFGGAYGNGTVYELTPNGDGKLEGESAPFV
jgi:uncharacterized repeat protein (TIGR03803 family)